MARSQSPSDKSNRHSPVRSPSVSSSGKGYKREDKSASRSPSSRGRSPIPSRPLRTYDISPLRKTPSTIPGNRGYLVSPLRRTPSPKFKRVRYASPVRGSSPKRRRYDSSPPRYRSRVDHRLDVRDNPQPCEVLGVFGLSYRTDERALRHEFNKYADVRSVKLVKDYDGRSRGFGFITFYDTKDASTAKEMMRGKVIDGVQPRIDYSITKHGLSVPREFDRSPLRDQSPRRGGGSGRGSPFRRDMSPARRHRGSGDRRR